MLNSVSFKHLVYSTCAVYAPVPVTGTGSFSCVVYVCTKLLLGKLAHVGSAFKSVQRNTKDFRSHWNQIPRLSCCSWRGRSRLGRIIIFLNKAMCSWLAQTSFKNNKILTVHLALAPGTTVTISVFKVLLNRDKLLHQTQTCHEVEKNVIWKTPPHWTRTWSLCFVRKFLRQGPGASSQPLEAQCQWCPPVGQKNHHFCWTESFKCSSSKNANTHTHYTKVWNTNTCKDWSTEGKEHDVIGLSTTSICLVSKHTADDNGPEHLPHLTPKPGLLFLLIFICPAGHALHPTEMNMKLCKPCHNTCFLTASYKNIFA